MNLIFWKGGGSEILDSRYADVDRGLAWGTDELSGNLVGRPLGSAAAGNGVDAAYVSENVRSEAHLYARDPRELKDMLTLNAASGLLQLPGTWDALTPPGALPRSVVLSANRFTEAKRRHLSTEDFFDDETPLGPAASPPGGSIKAVRVYNHGACSAETLTAPGDGTGLLDEVSEAVWKGFVEGVFVDGGECQTDRHPFLLSSSAVNFLDHTPREPRDLRGGFFLNAHYYASLPVVSDIETIFTARYQYTLVDGVLGLNDAFLSQNTDYPSIKDVPGSLKKGLLETLPQRFAELAKAKQTANILKDYPGVTACDPTGSYQCEGAAGFAGAAAKNGADTLEALGEESFSSKERIALSDAMMRRVKKGAPLTDWVCVEDGSELGGHCEFTVPAKRLNVYPDAVELVWFDGKEVKNPAYALYVMAHYSEENDPTTGKPIFNQKAVDELCSFDLPFVAPPREFAMSTRIPTDADYLWPEICSGLGTGSSCSFGGPSRSSHGWPLLAGLAFSLALVRRGRRSGGAPS